MGNTTSQLYKRKKGDCFVDSFTPNRMAAKLNPNDMSLEFHSEAIFFEITEINVLLERSTIPAL